MNKKFLLFVALFFMLHFSFAENPLRSVNAMRITGAPKIDGELSEDCWQQAETAHDFIQRDLHPGLPSEHASEVKLVYDDDAVYIGAILYDNKPDSILRELSTRDNEANADLFGVFFDTYNDDINAYGFFVTAAGTQIDARYSSQGQDFDWNAVWTSAVNINQKGWQVEMRIPYSALRFTEKQEQLWGFNIIRKVRRLRENSFWSPIDPKINTLVGQFGDLKGLQNIKPPLRLSFTPYVAGMINHYPYDQQGLNNLSYNASGGMDVKYGISEAFTLDMTLVPDFSQVQSDNQVLNLGPFEVQYQERRPFFTEGTELFNKGGLFYSRRVGGQPIDYHKVNDQLEEGETIYKNPGQTRLLNATKLSGRTESKLGIGLFNAVSGNTYATVKDTLGNTRQILTSPRSNYNILVLDQALRNNSFVTLVNTNVTREGHYYDANVTGALFNLNNKRNTYGTGGFVGMSNQFFPDSARPSQGYSGRFNFGKTGGNFKWAAVGSFNTDKWNPNDLGLQFMNNNIETGMNFNYNVYKPFWKLNNFYSGLKVSYSRMYKPSAFWNFGIYGDWVTTFSKRFLTTGGWFGVEPVITYDYYEPRVFGRFYTFPKNYNLGHFISSDYRKPFAIDINIEGRIFKENQRFYLDMALSPRYRVNNRLSFIYEIARNLRVDDIGFVHYNDTTDVITFGRRDIETVSNTLSSIYKFTNKMSLSFRMRHYWSQAQYKQYYVLGNDGLLTEQPDYARDHNVNFNAFNIDMVFFWQFAPGSELNLVWKDAVLKRENLSRNDYFNNFGNSLNSPQSNTLSVKVLYYIDYLTIRKSFKRMV